MNPGNVPALVGENQAPLTGYLRKKRMKVIAPYLRGNVLELGCGAASVLRSKALMTTIDRYVGCEYDREVVQLLQEEYPAHEFFQINLDSEHWGNVGVFDAIVGAAVVEHIWNQKNFYSNVVRLLKPEGHLVLTTPSVVGNDIVLATLSKLRLVRPDVIDDHIIIYNKARFMHVAHEFGLRLVRYKKFQLGLNQLVVFKKDEQRHREPTF